MILKRTLALALLGALWLGVPRGAGAAEPPPVEVAYSLEGEVVVARADGSAQRVLGSGIDPAWAPDGTRLVYGRESEVVVAEADGRAERIVAIGEGGQAVGEPAWSPDGDRIAFVESLEPFGARIVVVDATTGVRLIVSTAEPEVSDSFPSWSPDSELLAFTRRPAGLSPALWTIDAAGVERQLTERTAGLGQPAWSPDGRLIGFGAGDIFVISPAGGRPVAVAEPTAADLSGRHPVFSTDGARLAYAANPAGPDVTQNELEGRPDAGIYVVDLAEPDGTGVQEATSDREEVAVDWFAADRLVFSARSNDSGCDCYLWSVRTTTHSGELVADLEPSPVRPSERDVRPRFSPGLGLRVAGPSRVETAVEISELIHESAGAVVVGRADAYPDALAGAPLAASLGAPLLLTGSAALHPAAAAEVTRLGARTAYLMGSEDALSAQVEADLFAAGVDDVVRLAGVNRYATAARVAERLGSADVYVVEGAHDDPARGWPDAVAVSAPAAFQGRPILLVERGRLPEETRQALAGVQRATIVGGTAAVSAEVEAAIAAEGVTVDRVAGATRYETSVAVADRSLAAGMDPGTVWLATGANWPDSLAAGPAAASEGAVLLLASPSGLDASPPVLAWLEARRGEVGSVRLVGGQDVLAPAVRASAEVTLR